MKIVTALFLLPLLLLPTLLRAAGEPLPVWRISSDAGELVVLGSLHMAYPRTYPLRPGVIAAFDASDALVVEVDISRVEPADIQQLMVEIGAYPPGASLRDELSESTWNDLVSFLRGRGVPVEAVETLRPGLVVTMLGTMRFQELGMQPDLGIDLHFLERAGDEKPVMELESLQQQFELLLDFPSADLLVRQTLGQLRTLDEVLTPLYDAWLQGDLKQLERLLREDDLMRHPEFEPVYRRLFDDRNLAMVEKLDQLLRQGGSYFVVVGAGHLVGQQGMIALLEERGFRAEELPLDDRPPKEIE